MKKSLILSVFLSLMGLLPSVAQQSDTWVATDALGRVMPTSDECPLRQDKDRTVGIFYITWHTQNLHDGVPYRADVTRVLNTDPEARFQWENPAWQGASYHWGEPEYGYFLSRDRYVIWHDLMMLADAGVDVLILDVTNAVHYWDEWDALFQVMQEMRELGNRVPKFCFWAFNGNVTTVVQRLYERYYATGQHRDSWFYWEGKPLLLYNATPSVDANHAGGGMEGGDYSPEVKQFFTLRNMWWGYYKWAGERFVGTPDNWSFGYQMDDPSVAALSPKERCATHQGRLEQYAVTPAQHPISIVGKSWRGDTKEPALDDHDMPSPAYVPWLGKTVDDPTAYGIYFQDRWDEALEADPDFIYLNDWNEWTAGRYRSGIDPSGTQAGPTTFLGRENPFYFVDQYNAEFCRTIAPMKGGFTDSYYMQMVQNIRRYRGVHDIPRNYGYHSIRVDGDCDEWTSVPNEFEDTRGDVIHRDHDGYGDLHYADNSGRNDIVRAQVAVDARNLYFHVRCADAVTSWRDDHWMILLLDADRDVATGWEGFDYAVNLQVENDRQTWLMRYDSTLGFWRKCALVPYAVRDAHLELSVPRKLLHLTGKEMSFDFKWTDNPAALDNIVTVSTSGDTAPNRRFRYRFLWQKEREE